MVIVFAVHVLDLYFSEYASWQNFVNFIIKRIHLLSFFQVQLLKHIVLHGSFKKLKRNFMGNLAICNPLVLNIHSATTCFFVFRVSLVF